MGKAKDLSKEIEDYESPEAVNILHALVQKQHIGLPVAESGYLEFAGPRGPNLSPAPFAGGQDYMGRPHDKPQVPGYSMKYTLDF